MSLREVRPGGPWKAAGFQRDAQRLAHGAEGSGGRAAEARSAKHARAAGRRGGGARRTERARGAWRGDGVWRRRWCGATRVGADAPDAWDSPA